MAIFTLNGKEYDVNITALSETFVKLSTEKSGRTMDGNMFIDLIGVYYNYNLTIEREGSDVDSYDELFDVLSAPIAFYTMSFPHDQTMLTFEAYVTQGTRDLIRQYKKSNYWGEIKIPFVAKEPARRPI